MSHIFVSYSRSDYEGFVKNFVADLQADGVQVWIDQHNLRPGTPDWEQAVRQAIQQADAVLLVATPNSRKSAFVADEIAISESLGKRVYFVWAKGEQWNDSVRLGYGTRQHIDARSTKYQDALTEICKVLNAKPEWEQLLEEFKTLCHTLIEWRLTEHDDEYKEEKMHRRQLTIIDRWAEIGEAAAPTMVEALHYTEGGIEDGYGKTTKPLITALCPYKTKILANVVALLNSNEVLARWNAAEALRIFGDRKAVPTLIETLQDEDDSIRFKAIQALNAIGDTRAAIPTLIKVLKDKDKLVRFVAAEILERTSTKQALDAIKQWEIECPEYYASWQELKPFLTCLLD